MSPFAPEVDSIARVSPGECFCWQVVSAGEDGALFVVPIESTSAPQPFVEPRDSASYRAVRWASQQTFVSAGTTGVCALAYSLSASVVSV